MDNMDNYPGPRWKRIFFSPDGTRLRVGWRIVLQLILMLIFVSILQGGFILFTAKVFELPSWLNRLTNAILQLIAITASVYLARRYFDKRPLSSLGLKINKNTLPDILAGLLIPGLMMGLIFAIELGIGWLEYEGVVMEMDPPMAGIFDLFISFLVFVAVGWQEELLSRGYHLQNISESLNLFWGVLLSSLLFAVLHLFQPGASFISVILITLTGLFLALGYLRTRQLWLPIGLHIGWNFFEGPIFGFPVSGIETEGIMVHQSTGPELITGGAFGPEGGLILIPALILGALLVFWYTSDRKPLYIDESDTETEQQLDDASVAEDHLEE